jgi:hypothetical protein
VGSGFHAKQKLMVDIMANKPIEKIIAAASSSLLRRLGFIVLSCY